MPCAGISSSPCPPTWSPASTSGSTRFRSRRAARPTGGRSEMDNEFDIAIVGMAGRFPGAHALAEFWRNLDAGVESIARLTEDELLAAGVPRATLARADYVKAAPRLDHADRFDAAF